MLTVDGNGNALGEDVSIVANERRDLAQLVDLLVFLGDTASGKVEFLDLELEAVGFGNRLEDYGAWVALHR